MTGQTDPMGRLEALARQLLLEAFTPSHGDGDTATALSTSLLAVRNAAGDQWPDMPLSDELTALASLTGWWVASAVMEKAPADDTLNAARGRAIHITQTTLEVAASMACSLLAAHEQIKETK